MTIQYLDAVAGQDAIAEGWVEKRGRSTCFCRVEIRTAAGVLAATASVVYKVSSRTIAVPR
jgi:acyl-coenzyme A thioesterase PaaI-like protein